MLDFFVFTETRSPVFIFDPSTCAESRTTLVFKRIIESIRANELDLAVSLLDGGFKQKQFLPLFKFTIGVT